ncbi:MAG: nicotinate-nucleotide adenylyltransferase [Rhodocyclaceae bacterium]|nr:nicotinate-nucleotide adenylyltransferase [Rhodocyclaceae bacterium]
MKAPDGAIGILGGTFDPVHRAHLALARAALEKLGLAQVRWIPAGCPWHRGTPAASSADRLAMVKAAIQEEPRFVLDECEAKSGAPGYSVVTLERLREELGPARPIVLLMGADAFLGLPRWHRWRELFELAHLAVATRPGFPLEALTSPLAEAFARRRLASADFSAPAGGIYPFELVAGTVSATEVREKIAAGASDAELLRLLTPPVLDYIRAHQLYRA